MPSPRNAIPYVSTICIFLPCMEQVHRLITILKTHKFKDIRTFECLFRPADVKRMESTQETISTIKKMRINIIFLKEICYNKNDELRFMSIPVI
jgi:tRNA A58 N-methylase Trm61